MSHSAPCLDAVTLAVRRSHCTCLPKSPVPKHADALTRLPLAACCALAVCRCPMRFLAEIVGAARFKALLAASAGCLSSLGSLCSQTVQERPYRVPDIPTCHSFAVRLVEEMRSGVQPGTDPKDLSSQQVSSAGQPLLRPRTGFRGFAVCHTLRPPPTAMAAGLAKAQGFPGENLAASVR